MKHEKRVTNKKRNNSIVSIIMPVFNSAEFLNDSIGDIIKQTYSDFELICVYDDGTTDGSDGLLISLAGSEDRMKVIHNPIRGCNECRNRGMEEAKGKYLLFLDADDRFEPNMLKQIIDLAEKEHYEVTVFGGDMFDHETGEHRGAPRLIKSNEEPDTINSFKVFNTTIWNKLFLRQFIIEHDLKFRTSYNSPTAYFVFIAMVYANRIGVDRSILVHYRINNLNSTLANYDKYPLEAYDELLGIRDRLVKDDCFEEKREIFVGFAEEFIGDRLRAVNTSNGFKELYNTLHAGGIEALSICDKNIPPDSLLHEITAKDMGEYFFDNRKQIINAGVLMNDSWLLPIEKSLQVKRIIIYGGGNVGQDYFIQSIRRKDVKLVGWVDGNHEGIGYPLQPPESIKSTDFDFVLIAVSDSKTADSIKLFLDKMGIPEEKVFWKRPVRM